MNGRTCSWHGEVLCALSRTECEKSNVIITVQFKAVLFARCDINNLYHLLNNICVR